MRLRAWLSNTTYLWLLNGVIGHDVAPPNSLYSFSVDFPLTTRASCILPCQKHIIIWYNKGYPNIGVSDRSHEPSKSLYQQKEKESLFWKIGKFKDKIPFYVVDFPLTTLYIIKNLVPSFIELCVSVALNSNAVKSKDTIWVNASMATIYLLPIFKSLPPPEAIPFPVSLSHYKIKLNNEIGSYSVS